MTLRHTAILLLLAVPALGLADGRYDSLRNDARPVEDLGAFLERYLGRCTDGATRTECEQNVKAARRGLEGRAFTASVAEQTLDIVKAERTRAGFRFVVTPFIDGNGIALTNGEPLRQDAEGRPLIGLLVIDGALPSGMDSFDLETALRLGRVQLEVVFRPEGTWRLRRRAGSGFYEGVKAKFLGLRLVESRTGAEIASRVF